MSKPIQDPEALREYLRQHDQTEPAEHEQHEAEPRPCPVPIKPGSHNAAAAYRAGCEDEWADRMQAKYGGEW